MKTTNLVKAQTPYYKLNKQEKQQIQQAIKTQNPHEIVKTIATIIKNNKQLTKQLAKIATKIRKKTTTKTLKKSADFSLKKPTKFNTKKHAQKTLKQTCEKCVFKEDCRLYPNTCLEYFKCPRYKIQGLD